MIKKIKNSFLVFVCLVAAFCSASATVINQSGVPIKTDTNIVTNGNITDITTNTAVKGGTIGVNTFGKFNVSKGDIVNLHLINGQNKLVNLIYDSSPSQINGIINSYMNGKIGGNVLFANPNGFVIGADGVFNVGSLTLMTPTQQSMNSFINNTDPLNPVLNETQINKLVSFSFNGDNYLVCGDAADPIKLQQSTIEVYGKINSANGIDLISGGTVDIKTGAQLNANVEFNYDENDIMTGFAPKTSVSPSGPSTFAMNDGNGIVIVSSNDGTGDFLGAIVNLNGNIAANGSNVIVRTEIDNAISDSTSQINMNATLSAKELTLSALHGSITSTDADFTVDSLSLFAFENIELVNKGDINISTILSEENNITLTSYQGSIKTVNSSVLKADELTLNAAKGSVVLGTVETNYLDLTSGSAEITDLTSKNRAKFRVSDSLALDTASVGFIDAEANSISITTSLNTTSIVDASHLTTTSGNIDLVTLNIAGDVMLSAKGNISATSATIGGDAEFYSDKAVSLGTTTVNNIILNSGSAEVTSLTTTGSGTITTNGALKLDTGSFSDVTINSASIDVTTLNSTANVSLTSTSGNINVINLSSGQNSTLTSNNGKVTLGSVDVANDFTSVSKTLEVTTAMAVGGKVEMTADDINIVPAVQFTDLTIDTDKLIFDDLTVTGKADIKATESFTVDTANIKDLVLNAGDINATTKLDVTNSANITATGKITAGTVSINSLEKLSAKSAEIENLTITSTNNKVITVTDELKLGTTVVDSIVLNAGNIKLGQTTVAGTLTANAKKDLTINGDINVTGKTILSAGDNLVFENTQNVVFNNDLIIENTGAVNLESLTVKGNLTTDASILNISDKLTVTGTANLGSKSNITIKDTDINILDTKGATNVTIENLNVKQNGTIIAKGDVVLTKTNVGGDFKLESKNLTLKDTTTVTGTTSLKATEKLTFVPEDVTFNNDLTIEKGTGIVEVNHLTVNGNANLNSNGATNITTAVINGDLTTDASILNISDKLTVTGTANLGSKSNITIKDTDINILDTKGATNVTIENLNVKQNGTIIAKGDVVLTKTNVGGDFKLESKNLTLKDTTTVTGTTSLKATEKLTFVPEDVTFNNDLTIEKGTGIVEINNLTVTGGKTVMNSNDLITIRNAQLDDLTTYANNMTVDNMTVEGPININNTGNLSITDKLIANDEVNMRSDASINIKDADMAKDLYLNSKNAKIEEINLTGKMNGNVDKLSVNTSNNLNIGTLRGKSKSYVTSTTVNTEKAILNALEDNKAMNIYGKNIKLVSVDNTATADKPLNLKLAKNNNITLLSEGDIEVFTTGEVGNYRKIVTDHLKIKTDSYGVNIYSAIVKIDGDIRTADKHIIIDNTTWKPNLYVTLQLRSIVSPHYLFVDGSPFISTQSINALRHGMNIYVNKTKDATSMNSWLTSSIEACMKTINTTQKSYEEMTKNNSFEAVIKTVNGEIVSSDNVVEFINFSNK